MATVLLAALGSQGDVLPFFAIARSLEQLGVKTCLLVNPKDVPLGERLGLQTIGVGEFLDVETFLRENPKYLNGPRSGAYINRDLFIPSARDYFVKSMELIRELDVKAVVSHSFSYGSTWAARASGLPVVIPHLAPISLLTPEAFAHYPGFQRFIFNTTVPMGMKMFSKMARKTCEELGVEWTPDLMERSICRPDLLLGMWSPGFADLESFKQGGTSVMCGFPLLDQVEETGPELREFLDAGEPPVVFTMGASSVYLAGDFYSNAAEVCRKQGLRGLLIGHQADPGGLPEDVMAVEFAHFAKVFPRCRAVVHHGGIGTTALALRAGIPAVVIPFGADQNDNALRAQLTGTARVLARKKMSTRLLQALEEILTPEMVARAAALGAQISKEENGAQVAAREIRKLLEVTA